MKKIDIAAIGELNVDIILNGIESEQEVEKKKFASSANAASLESKYTS